MKRNVSFTKREPRSPAFLRRLLRTFDGVSYRRVEVDCRLGERLPRRPVMLVGKPLTQRDQCAEDKVSG